MTQSADYAEHDTSGKQTTQLIEADRLGVGGEDLGDIRRFMGVRRFAHNLSSQAYLANY